MHTWMVHVLQAFLISSGRATTSAVAGALQKAKAIAGRAKVGITGVKNVYTQHRPVVEQVCSFVSRGLAVALVRVLCLFTVSV